MLRSKFVTSAGLFLAATVSTGLFTATANAAQMVGDLVPKQWQEITRSVELRDKMYSANLYGDSASVQVLFENNGNPTTLVNTDLSTNSDSYSCRAPQAGDDLGTLDPTYTEICSFDPKLILTDGNGTQGSVDDYWMHVKMAMATGRTVILRYQQPVPPQCSDSTATDTYNLLNTCSAFSSSITIKNNNIHKPSMSYNNLTWAPLAIKGQTYQITLHVGSNNGGVEVVNGVKLKVSGSTSANPNDEVMEGIEFSPSCSFEADQILAAGSTHTCTFTVGDDGFLHIPLKRVNTSKTPTITTTITNITQ